MWLPKWLGFIAGTGAHRAVITPPRREREQWNAGNNVLALQSGVVVGY